ncbi:MAG: hypothetical protein EGP70_04940 [Butyricicoccus sp.]|nr:hypothetical protein [Butyricicoccus sp.]
MPGPPGGLPARSLRPLRRMRNFRERYWRYSLFVLILGLGITICIELTPFLGGLLGAAPIMPIKTGSPAKFIGRGGRIPAPIQSLKN